MLQAYYLRVRVYYKDKLISDRTGGSTIEDDFHVCPMPEVSYPTWENIGKLNLPYYGIADYHTKKGLKLKIFYSESHLFFDGITIKQWKEPKLDIRIETSYILNTHFTLSALMKGYSIDTTIQYLKERAIKYEDIIRGIEV